MKTDLRVFGGFRVFDFIFFDLYFHDFGAVEESKHSIVLILYVLLLVS